MPVSKNPQAYPHIAAILETCLDHNEWPATYTLPSPNAAIRWRLEANSYRAALRYREEQNRKLSSGTGTSIYDNLVFRILPTDLRTVLIEQRENPGELRVGGRLVTAAKTPLDHHVDPDLEDLGDLAGGLDIDFSSFEIEDKK